MSRMQQQRFGHKLRNPYGSYRDPLDQISNRQRNTTKTIGIFDYRGLMSGQTCTPQPVICISIALYTSNLIILFNRDAQLILAAKSQQLSTYCQLRHKSYSDDGKYKNDFYNFQRCACQHCKSWPIFTENQLYRREVGAL